MNISICICTRKRQEGLKRLLNSFDEMRVPPGINVRIIIVENDTDKYSENVVKEFSEKSNLEVSYFLESRQGIVYARNRSVAEAGNCDFCYFTDDDQIVSSEWLAELLKCQQEFDADGVAGPTIPSFTVKVPPYIEKFHQPDNYPYGTCVESAFTGCLMLRKRNLDMLDGPFDERLNFSGGEDSFITRQIIRRGGKIRFNPDAKAYEFIPAERSTVKFIFKRVYRTANTALLIRSINENDFTMTKVLPRLVMRFCNGLLILFPYLIFGKADKMKGLIKIINASAGFAFFFGKKSQFYK